MLKHKIIVTILVVGIASVIAGFLFSTKAQSDITSQGLSQLQEDTLKHEKLISECMQEAGFKYEVTMPRDVIIETVLLESPEDEQAVKEAQESLDIDPNDAYLATLSEAEQDAWLSALHGEGGCNRATYEKAWGVDLETINDELEKKHLATEQDPRVIEAKKQRTVCVQERGYDVVIEDDSSFERYTYYEKVKLFKEHGYTWEEQEPYPDKALGEKVEEWYLQAKKDYFECHKPYRDVYDMVRKEMD